MYKYRVRIDTGTDIKNFVATAEKLPFNIFIENENGAKRGNAKTLLNVVDAMTYRKIYILSDNEIYTPFRDFIINET
jgi:hypothetical protein